MLLRPALGLAVVIAPVATGCQGAEEPSHGSIPPRVVGLIVDIEEDEGAVQGFLLEADGERYDVLIDPEIDYGFDLRHLREHLRLEQPVDVALERRDGAIYATEILDA